MSTSHFSKDILIERSNQSPHPEFKDSESMDVIVENTQLEENLSSVGPGKHGLDEEVEVKSAYSKLDLPFSSYPQSIQILFEDLQSLNCSKVSNSISFLPLLSTTLGPENTRLKLLPYLSYILEYTEEQEQILTALAHVLNTEYEHSLTVKNIGGADFISASIIPLLGDLVYYSDSYSILNELV